MSALLDPAVLFFVLGVAAGLLRSNLEIPRGVARFLSLYLLMAIGLKGGFALAQSGLNTKVLSVLAAALFLAAVIPLLGFCVLRRHAAPLDAVGVAAAYGSVSAVTFVTAVQAVEQSGLTVGGHMAIAMVLMESPAIVFALMAAHRLRQGAAGTRVVGGASLVLTIRPQGAGSGASSGVAAVLRDSFTDGTQILLLGSLLIGALTGPAGQASMQPFSGDLFKGLLAFFLLDMGLQVARHARSALAAAKPLLVYALLAPPLHAGLALALSVGLALPVADAALLMVLAASASYIVVPAVLRHAIPEANPALYLGLSLGVTFPFNILLGIPVYLAAAQWALG